MLKKFLIFLILFVLIFSLTGCWGKRELDEIDIVIATGIDTDESGGITVTVICTTPIRVEQGASLQRSTAWVGVASGENIADAFLNLRRIATKRLVWFQNRLIIISQGAAKTRMKSIMDFLTRNREIRYENYVLITGNSARDMLLVPADVEKNLQTEILGLVENANEWSKSYVNNIKEFMVSLSHKDAGIVTGRLDYYNSTRNSFSTSRELYKRMPLEGEKLSIAYLEGGAVFKGYSMVGWLDGIETRGYLWVTGKVGSGVLLVDNPRGKGKTSISIEGVEQNTSFKKENDKIIFKVKLEVQGDIMNVGNDGYNINKNLIASLENNMSEAIIKEMDRAVNKAQKQYKTDIFGLGRLVFKKDPAYWRRIEQQWDKIYPKADIRFDVKSKIIRTGITTGSRE